MKFLWGGGEIIRNGAERVIISIYLLLVHGLVLSATEILKGSMVSSVSKIQFELRIQFADFDFYFAESEQRRVIKRGFK